MPSETTTSSPPATMPSGGPGLRRTRAAHSRSTGPRVGSPAGPGRQVGGLLPPQPPPCPATTTADPPSRPSPGHPHPVGYSLPAKPPHRRRLPIVETGSAGHRRQSRAGQANYSAGRSATRRCRPRGAAAARVGVWGCWQKKDKALVASAGRGRRHRMITFCQAGCQKFAARFRVRPIRTYLTARR
jgi:hypothetical protein